MKALEKAKAKSLRARGYSVGEISGVLGVSKSSVSVWVRDVLLSNVAEKRIESLKVAGSLKSQGILRSRKLQRLEESRRKARSLLKHAGRNKFWEKIVCALVYWCEGSKQDSLVAFMNSDPNLIALFLSLLRKNFNVDEAKFRACIHLHDYHDKEKQIEFWSGVTGISKSRFIKPYLKKNGGVNVRKNYQGCVSIRYYDARLAQDLNAIARAYMGL